ncbi:MAG: hypothetical protein ABI855_05315 [Bacteroidota bacterium]
MLLQLEKAKKATLRKLLEYAKANRMQLTLVDADKTKTYLPGKQLTEKELKNLIVKSRKSGIVSMTEAHRKIRKKINGD